MSKWERFGNFLGFLTALCVFSTIVYFILGEFLHFIQIVSYQYYLLTIISLNVFYDILKPKSKKKVAAVNL